MKKILIVDDQPSMAMLLSEILEDENCQVVAASNGERGIARAKEFKPDIILMDIMMPVKDGITAIRELRALPEFKNTPIFILSAKGDTHTADLVQELDISGYIHKPFSPSKILEAINKNLT